MRESVTTVVRDCHEASEHDRMNFPQILAALSAAGIEGYTVDYRRATKTYYQPDGDSLELSFPAVETPVAAGFDVDAVQAAIREAQSGAEGYTYRGFCERVMAAGCAGYIVSILGRRVVYFGRMAQTHVELFPAS